VDPYARLVLDGRVGHEPNLVAGMQALHVAITASEDSSVHGGSEERRPSVGKWRCRLHTHEKGSLWASGLTLLTYGPANLRKTTDELCLT